MVTPNTANTSAPTRVIFMGTPDFAVPALNALIADPAYTVVGVVTQPDRPGKRGKDLIPPPVKVAALAANIPIFQPEKLRQPGAIDQLSAWAPDLIVVAAFGQILRQNVLDLPKFGCINIHASLLPRWRGAAPIQAALRAGDAETGITIMRMDAGLDTGGMILSQAIPITEADTGGTLHDKLSAIGGKLLLEALPRYLSGELPPRPQDDALQTYASMLKKEDGLVDWSQSAVVIDRHVRAYTPTPTAYTLWNGQVLKLFPAPDLPHVIASDSVTDSAVTSASIGQVIRLTESAIIAVKTGSGLYRLGAVQLPGKTALPVRDFLNGYPNFVGSMLGNGAGTAE